MEEDEFVEFLDFAGGFEFLGFVENCLEVAGGVVAESVLSLVVGLAVLGGVLGFEGGDVVAEDDGFGVGIVFSEFGEFGVDFSEIC